jgi:hypothetical protein
LSLNTTTATTKEKPMKLTLKTPKPRNPFVAASLRRSAGSHRSGGASQRQQAGRELQREIQRLRHSP